MSFTCDSSLAHLACTQRPPSAMSVEELFGPDETDSEKDEEDDNDVPSEHDDDSDLGDEVPPPAAPLKTILRKKLNRLHHTRTTPRRTATSTRRAPTTANRELRSTVARGAACATRSFARTSCIRPDQEAQDRRATSGW